MKHLRIALCALTLCTIGVAAGAEVPHVENSAEPRDGIVEYGLEELWRVGGPEDDANLFGVIVQVLSDDAGNLFLLDQQLSEVAVISPVGERIATLSREGDGPGETRRPMDMFFLPDGTIAIVQIFPGRIVLVDSAGNPAGTFDYKTGDAAAAAGFSVLIGGKSRSGNIVLAGIDQSFGSGLLDQTYFLRGYTPEGAVTVDYVNKTGQQNFADMKLDEIEVDFVWRRWDLRGDGGVVMAPERNTYRLEIRDVAGELQRTFSRPYEPLPREESDTNRAIAVLEAQGRNYPVMPRISVSDVEPDLSGVQALDDGTIWVTTSRGVRDHSEGVMATYDVFDAEGVFTHQARIHADADGLNDQLFFVDAERVLLVRNFLDAYLSSVGVESENEDTGLMEVISCRLVRQ